MLNMPDLLAAISANNIRLVKSLVENIVNVKDGHDFRYSLSFELNRLGEVLTYAFELNRFDIADYLVEQGANTAQIPDSKLQLTNLFQEFVLENTEEIKKLLANNKYCTNYINRFLLHAAKRNLKLFEFLLENGVDINAVDSQGETPLSLALETNNTSLYLARVTRDSELIECMIEHNADTSIMTNLQLAQTTLFQMCMCGNREEIKKLLSKNKYCSNYINRILVCMAKSNLEMFRFLLENGADINAIDRLGKTPFRYALETQENELIECMIAHNANIPLENNLGYISQTALFKMCLEENIAEIKRLLEQNTYCQNYKSSCLIYSIINNKFKSALYLIEQNTDTNMTIKGKTALMYALEKQEMILIECMIAHNTDTSFMNDLQLMQTILFKMCLEENIAEIKRLLEQNTYCQDYKNRSLLYCITNNKVNAFKCLIENGTTYYNEVALIKVAIKEQNCEIINYLIGDNLLGNIQDFIKYAIQNNRLQSLKFLTGQNIEINIRDSLGKTYLMYAIENSEPEIIKYLVDKGADVNAKDNSGKSILMYALERNDLNIIKSLGKNNIVFDNPDSDGKTILVYAIGNCSAEIIKYLIDNIADVNVKDNLGKTYLIYAVENNDLEIIKYLLDRGANINAKDNSGKSILIYAIETDNPNIIEYLFEKNKDFNLKDILICALNKRKFKIAADLISPNDDFDAHSIDRQVLMDAINIHNFYIVDYLIKRNANTQGINFKDISTTELFKTGKNENTEELKRLLTTNNYCQDYKNKCLLYMAIINILSSTMVLVEHGATITQEDFDTCVSEDNIAVRNYLSDCGFVNF